MVKSMKRAAMHKLTAWKEDPRRLPLIIRGARQVGKTWLMKEFGKRCFENVVYINFENNRRMKNVFAMDYDVERILSALKIESGKKNRSK